MKKSIKLLAVVSMVGLFLAGCNNNANQPVSSDTVSKPSVEELKNNTPSTDTASVTAYVEAASSEYTVLTDAILKVMEEGTTEIEKDEPDVAVLETFHQEIVAAVEKASQKINGLTVPKGAEKYKEALDEFLKTSEEFVTIHGKWVKAMKDRDAEALTEVASEITDISSKLGELDGTVTAAKEALE